MRKPAFLLFVALLILFATSFPAQADQIFYIGPNNGLWSNGANWDAGVPPQPGDDVIVGQFLPNRLGDVNVVFDGNYPDANHALISLKLDATGTSGAIILNQSSGNSRLYSLAEYIGTGGHAATFSQSAGVNTFGDNHLYLGFDPGSSGSYFLSGTGLLTGASLIPFGALYVGYSGTGTVLQTGGTANIGFLYLAANAGSAGTYTLTGGELDVACPNCEPGVGEIIGLGDNASFTQTGGTHTVGLFNSGGVGIGDGSSYTLSGGTFHIKRGGGSGAPTGGVLINEGIFNVAGGTLMLTGSDVPTGAKIRNLGPPDGHGVFNYTSGSISFPNGGTIENTGTFNISVANGMLSGSVTNSSLFQINGSVVSFEATFTNNDRYISTAPSRQTFTTMTIGANGTLQGGAGDVFEFGRNLTNNSTKSATFDLSRCWVVLSGNGVQHRLSWPATDLGAVSSGYANNFAIGVLKLSSGNSLVLLDGNATAGGAIYTEVLLLDGGVAQIASISGSANISIYYDPNNAANNYLQGNTYAISGGGVIAPVPSRTPPPDPTPSPSPAASPTPTAAPTATPVSTPTATATATPTATPTAAATSTPSATPASTASATPTPVQALNIATRLRVDTGSNVLIGGFIITGSANKNVVIRGIGPSLSNFGVGDPLVDPTLELRSNSGSLIFANDDWEDNSAQAAQISAAGLALQNSKESGIFASLQPSAYTAILAGKNQGAGIGLVEIYDTNGAVDAQLANISTRGFVLSGNNVMIGGFILGGNGTTRVGIRGIGPSLAAFGLTPVLNDPTLELHDSNGSTLIANDDWQDDSTQAAQLSANGLAPTNSKESGIFTSLPPGAFTAILAGKSGGTGIGVVEVYNLH